MDQNEIRALRKEIDEATELTRSGRWTSSFFARLCSIHKAGQLDRSLFLSFGWYIYHRLKHSPLNNALERKRLLLQYLRLDLERPSLLHSLILNEAIKLKKKTPSQFRFRDFITLWGINNLRKEDWEKYRPDIGRAHKSLAENMIGVYVQEINKAKCAASKEFVIVLEKALTIYPSNPYLPLYLPIVYRSQGRREEALECYRTLLNRWPNKYVLWSRAEELLPKEDLDLRIAMLCKAVTLVRDKTLLGDILLRLANLFHKKGLPQYAKHELNQYLLLYTSQGWHIKDWYETLNRLVETTAPAVTPSRTPYEAFLPLITRFTKPGRTAPPNTPIPIT